MRRFIVKELLSELSSKSCANVQQKGAEYLRWAGPNMASFANEFVEKNKLQESYFIKGMNNVFKTSSFNVLFKKWVVAYLWEFFIMLDDFAVFKIELNRELILEDNSLNRFAVEKYRSRFKILPKITWKKKPSLLQRLFSVLLRPVVILRLSLNSGIKISGRLRKYKVMREALWGLYDVGGYYFHDDFLVDGNKIKKEDILLFSRGVPIESGRLKGYEDAKKSPYAHFNIESLPIGINVIFSRVIYKYIFSATKIFYKEINSPEFSLYWSVYSCFIYNAIPYEKVFSHFKIISELGHNFYSLSHIPESIVCQNYRAKYYLMHWSDISLSINNYLLSFLECDGFLIWGRVHINGVGGASKIFIPTGYIFKKFIKKVESERKRILLEMGIQAKGKVISFFDESFGRGSEMTEKHYVDFWDAILKTAQQEKDNTVIVKPKEAMYHASLSDKVKAEFFKISEKISKLENVHIIDENMWSFIEVIGVSDIIITQGMTSSATIAIICGKEGLYLDQFGYKHIFSRLFKDKIVFDNAEKLINMIHKIVSGNESPRSYIPEKLIRAFDEHIEDNKAAELFSSILSGQDMERFKKRIGVILQARMGSTRLPGKVMLPLLGKPVLQHIIERLKDSQNIDEIIIATTENRKDDIIADLTKRNGLKIYRGSENDVLSRFFFAAKENKLDIIVRITADCPLIDPEIIDKMIELYLQKKSIDYFSNTIKRTFPKGLDVEIFNFKMLENAFHLAKEPYQREHVTPYMYENKNRFSLDNYCASIDNSGYRLTLDTLEDFELIKNVYSRIYPANPKFRLKDIINVFKEDDLLESVNLDAGQMSTRNRL